MRFRSTLAAVAVIAMLIGLSGCRNGFFRRDQVYYCQPSQCQATQCQPVVSSGQPMVCCPQ